MLPQPTRTSGQLYRRATIQTAALLAVAALAGFALADEPAISEDRLFQPVDLHGDGDIGVNGVPYGEPLAGQPFQDFTIQPPPRTFPNCRQPLLSWRLGPGLDCAQYGANVALDIPAHAIRKAEWYSSTDLVAIKRDPYTKLTFAQVGVLGAGTPALSTANIDYPLDAGVQFSIGRKLTERLSFEALYMGQNDWQSQAAVRNSLDNTLIGGTTTGALASPFTQFGLLGQQPGLDLNNFVSVSTTDRLEMLDLAFRYRPDMPYGAYDVSFLYGLRYMQTGETLQYHSESFEPTPGGAINDLNVATDNDLIGNFQIMPRLTLRAGYQAMFTTGMATAVGNFQTDLDIVRFGPSTINTRDEVIYHGPVAGIMWER